MQGEVTARSAVRAPLDAAAAVQAGRVGQRGVALDGEPRAEAAPGDGEDTVLEGALRRA
ncbi:hypothetical protein [Streptomyces sp. NPDC006134]|uniref:hypothetical protein n=1 Tax=Streptomyces sp. NPDC006134 TaxID=3154467 RepID=UPI0033FC8113